MSHPGTSPPLAAALVIAIGLSVACGGSAPDAPTDVTYPHDIPIDSALGFGFELDDPRFADVIDVTAGVVVLAGGFTWAEGPVWVPAAGELLFSDVPANVVYRYDPASVEARAPEGVWGVDTFLYPSGYLAEPDVDGEPGANGLLLDGDGRLLLLQHGERRVVRLRQNLRDALARRRPIRPRERDFEVLADRYDGRRLNSPNDVARASDGTLYFTDPPYGVDKTFGEGARELDFSGVYRLAPGADSAQLLYRGLERPNGIALTPDESALIVSNSQADDLKWVRLSLTPLTEAPTADTLAADTALLDGEVFADLTARVGPERPGSADGMYVLPDGTLLATGPGGVIVFAADGTVLGTIRTGRATANVTVGGRDGRDVFIAADDLLLEARLAEAP